MKIYLSGVQGVGKTVIARSIVEQVEKIGIEMSHFSTSEVLMRHYRVSNRQELEGVNIPQDKRGSIFEQIYRNHEHLILDGNFRLSSQDPEIFDYFIFLDASDEEILDRRSADQSRERNLAIDSIQKSRREELSRIRENNIACTMIHNIGNIHEVTTEILRTMNPEANTETRLPIN